MLSIFPNHRLKNICSKHLWQQFVSEITDSYILESDVHPQATTHAATFSLALIYTWKFAKLIFLLFSLLSLQAVNCKQHKPHSHRILKEMVVIRRISYYLLLLLVARLKSVQSSHFIGKIYRFMGWGEMITSVFDRMLFARRIYR